MSYSPSSCCLIKIVKLALSRDKINLAIEKYIYNTELNDYIENSMITIVNIYKLLINFNSTESIVKLNQTFLNIINKNTEAKLMANYFDKEFLINFSKK